METIEQYLKVLDKIQGLSAVALVYVAAIVIGYLWRACKWKWFSNDATPIVVILSGAFNMSMLADPRSEGMPPRVWFFRNVLVGLAIGFIAWLSHNLVLKRIEDWVLSKVPSLGNTSFFTKQSKSDNTPNISNT